MPDVKTFINKYFPDARYSSGEYSCKCPSHNDIRESLHVRQGDVPDGNGGTKIVMNCKAGCSNEEILKTLGASMDEINGRNRKRDIWKKLERYFSLGSLTDIYDYRDPDDGYMYSKLRFRDLNDKKQIRYARINYRSGSFKGGRGGLDPTLYQLPELIRSIEAGYPVYIVEGEKDVHTLRDQLYYRATTPGGAGDWKEYFARYFKGTQVIILPDNDKPGKKAAEVIQRDLLQYAYQVKIVNVSGLDHGDVTDYLSAEGGTPESLKKLIDEQPWVNAPWVTVDKKDKHTINTDLLAGAIDRNDAYLIVRSSGEERDPLYVYRNGVYSRVNKNQFIGRIIRPYIPKGRATANLLDNTMKLLLTSENHSVNYDDLDQDEQYINMKNGLLNIDTWELEAHRTEVLSTIQLDVEYVPGCLKKRNFDHYMRDLIRSPDDQEDNEKAMVLQEFFGMVLSNIPMYKLKKALFLISYIGNTGKSSLLRLIDSMLGEGRTAAIDLKELDNSSSNRFMLGSMRGKRLIECGDQSSATINDSSTFKRLTGGDLQKIEEKGKQGNYFRYGGGLVIASNQIPFFQDDHGKHLIDRIQMIPLQHTIIKKDSELETRMLQEKSAIFNWFMEGLKRIRENNYQLTECGSVTEFMKEYRENNDSLYRFLTERYEITNHPKDLVSLSDFNFDYHIWCSSHNAVSGLHDRIQEVRKKNIKIRMSSYGINVKLGTIGHRRNITCYVGIKKKEGFDG